MYSFFWIEAEKKSISQKLAASNLVSYRYAQRKGWEAWELIKSHTKNISNTWGIQIYNVKCIMYNVHNMRSDWTFSAVCICKWSTLKTLIDYTEHFACNPFSYTLTMRTNLKPNEDEYGERKKVAHVKNEFHLNELIYF